MVEAAKTEAGLIHCGDNLDGAADIHITEKYIRMAYAAMYRAAPSPTNTTERRPTNGER